MLRFVSNKGGGDAVDIETAILSGYAPDGGLYVPEDLPRINKDQLEAWKDFTYPELAFEILSLFIDRNTVSSGELKSIIEKAYGSFEKDDVIPIHKLKSQENAYVLELFYGSTLSFKDVGMSFLVNLIDFFLARKETRLSIIIATTGDTGPAAASYIAGKSTLDAWVLYPKGMITEEQERQMTTLHQSNVHPVGVYNCPEGGDDLDAVIKKLYANEVFKEKVNLSSVNSLNWGRIMIQTVHYFYAYFQVAAHIGEDLSMAVPSGGFGNLCAGGLARKMGLPVKTLIAANNKNECLNRIFRDGVFSMDAIHETVSSAIDILVPMNFWRYLYFCVDKDSKKIKGWVDEFEEKGSVKFDKESFVAYKEGFLSASVTDEETVAMIKRVYEEEDYLLDPHAAVSLAVVDSLSEELGKNKIIYFATAHPAKFPNIIREALGEDSLPSAAKHPSLERAATQCQKGYTAEKSHLEMALVDAMEGHWHANAGV